MPIPPEEKEQILRDVGMIIADSLPPEYAAVVDSLTPDELEMLVSVRKRIDLGETVSGNPFGEVFVAP